MIADKNFKQPTFSLSSSGLTGQSSKHRRRLLDARLRGHDGQANAPPARVFVRRRVRLSSYPQGAPGGVVPRKMPEGAERRQAHQPFHACEARRASWIETARLWRSTAAILAAGTAPTNTRTDLSAS